MDHPEYESILTALEAKAGICRGAERAEDPLVRPGLIINRWIKDTTNLDKDIIQA